MKQMRIAYRQESVEKVNNEKREGNGLKRNVYCSYTLKRLSNLSANLISDSHPIVNESVCGNTVSSANEHRSLKSTVILFVKIISQTKK